MLTAGSAKNPPPRSLALTGWHADRVRPSSEGAKGDLKVEVAANFHE